MIDLRTNDDQIYRDVIDARALDYIANYRNMDPTAYLEFHGTGLVLADMTRLRGIKHVVNHLTIRINELT
jgi:hypothetical protein